jgi:hypothetical protein
LSNELLRNVGTSLYGEEWQAPLARDLDVGERTMRRWAAGTEGIPQGVWRDVGIRLQIWQATVGYLVRAVNHAGGLIEVHAFKVWDHAAGDMRQIEGMSTAERIEKIGGKIIPGTAEWHLPSAIDAEGRLVARRGPAPKEKRTARELADMIATKIGVGGVFVTVHKDPAYGWHPTVMTAPAAAVRCQALAEEIAADLRAKYDLQTA